VHLLPRSSKYRDAAKGGVRVQSRVRSRRRSESCTTPIAGHVAASGLRRPAAAGRVPLRGQGSCRRTFIDRTPVRSEPTTRQPARLIRLVTAYQRALEGRPSPCRFTPSCSAYAKQALESHGMWRGLWLALRRIVRCRPFGPSGWDPVPVPRGQHSLRERFNDLLITSQHKGGPT